jgi:hypothetical protein
MGNIVSAWIIYLFKVKFSTAYPNPPPQGGREPEGPPSQVVRFIQRYWGLPYLTAALRDSRPLSEIFSGNPVCRTLPLRNL